jgi:hypothetical protein
VHAVVVLLIAGASPAFPQATAAGTWRADGVGSPFPWELVLRVTEQQVTGLVSACPRAPSEVTEVHQSGNELSFRCTRDDRAGTIAFTATLEGDQMTIEWRLPSGENTSAAVASLANSALYGSSAPARFTVRRIPDGDLAKAADQLARRVRGAEFSDTITLDDDNMRMLGTIFIPETVKRVRVVIVAFRWGSGSLVYADEAIRKMCEILDAALLLADFATVITPTNSSPRHDGAASLLVLLDRLAQDSHHPELRVAPLVLFGHSAAASLPGIFAATYPGRVVAFVRYHAGMLAVLGGDVQLLSGIPALFLIQQGDDGYDNVPPTWRSREYWRSGRAASAPWTYVLDPTADHGSEEALRSANRLLIPWLTAVVRQRLPEKGASLRPLPDTTGWLGDIDTGEIAPYSQFLGQRTAATWLPDEAAARGWQAIAAVK